MAPLNKFNDKVKGVKLGLSQHCERALKNKITSF